LVSILLGRRYKGDQVTLQEAIEQSGYKTRPYSGRGMYGKECLGVQVASIGDLYILGTKIGKLTAVASIHWPSIDTLGLNIIAYWPTQPFVPQGQPGDHN
jgi:hypothetical protein